MSVKAVVTVVGAAVAFGAAALRMPARTESAIRESAATSVIEDHDDVVGIEDNTGTALRAVWGPYTDPTLQVTATVSSPDTHLSVMASNGDYFVYVTGHFSGLVPTNISLLNQKDAMLPLWPIVYTDRVKVGAQGTCFILHYKQATQVYTLIRLREKDDLGAWAGGSVDLQVIASGAAKKITSNQAENKFVSYKADTGAISLPAPLGQNEQNILTEVIRRAALRGLHVPPEASEQ